MPKLIWCVRDSKMDMKDKHGNQMAENEFLEFKLSEIARSSGQRKVSHTRDVLLNMFPDRELVSMRHPLGDFEGDPGDMESMGEDGLDKGFNEDKQNLYQKMLLTPVKQIWSRKIDGATLSFLLTEYV